MALQLAFNSKLDLKALCIAQEDEERRERAAVLTAKRNRAIRNAVRRAKQAAR